jgi:hypothetical protein
MHDLLLRCDAERHGRPAMRAKDLGGGGNSGLVTHRYQTAQEVRETSGSILGPSKGGGYGPRPLWPISDINSIRIRGSSLNFPSMARVIASESCF